jgi:hypothetical protein
MSIPSSFRTVISACRSTNAEISLVASSPLSASSRAP